MDRDKYNHLTYQGLETEVSRCWRLIKLHLEKHDDKGFHFEDCVDCQQLHADWRECIDEMQHRIDNNEVEL